MCHFTCPWNQKRDWYWRLCLPFALDVTSLASCRVWQVGYWECQFLPVKGNKFANFLHVQSFIQSSHTFNKTSTITTVIFPPGKQTAIRSTTQDRQDRTKWHSEMGTQLHWEPSVMRTMCGKLSPVTWNLIHKPHIHQSLHLVHGLSGAQLSESKPIHWAEVGCEKQIR